MRHIEVAKRRIMHKYYSNFSKSKKTKYSNLKMMGLPWWHSG